MIEGTSGRFRQQSRTNLSIFVIINIFKSLYYSIVKISWARIMFFLITWVVEGPERNIGCKINWLWVSFLGICVFCGETHSLEVMSQNVAKNPFRKGFLATFWLITSKLCVSPQNTHIPRKLTQSQLILHPMFLSGPSTTQVIRKNMILAHEIFTIL